MSIHRPSDATRACASFNSDELKFLSLLTTRRALMAAIIEERATVHCSTELELLSTGQRQILNIRESKRFWF